MVTARMTDLATRASNGMGTLGGTALRRLHASWPAGPRPKHSTQGTLLGMCSGKGQTGPSHAREQLPHDHRKAEHISRLRGVLPLQPTGSPGERQRGQNHGAPD